MVVSVVIICRNESETVGPLIQSVLDEIAGRPSEVVVVDSASTDGTADIAARYPVTVLRLHPDQPLSAAAGRHVGFEWTTGDVVLFLDGDMRLSPSWLDLGLEVLSEHPEVAAVTGSLIENGAVAATPKSVSQSSNATFEVLFAGGAALYRRRVLEDVGGFNPYVRSDEEPELCLRIRHAGYKILQTDRPIAYHLRPQDYSVFAFLRRWRNGLYIGSGQNLRYFAGTPLFWPYVRERGFGVPPLLAVAAGLATIGATLVTNHKKWLYGWLSTVAAIVAGDVMRHRDLRRTLRALVHRALLMHGMIRGLLMPPRSPSTYPARLDVIVERRSTRTE